MTSAPVCLQVAQSSAQGLLEAPSGTSTIVAANIRIPEPSSLGRAFLLVLGMVFLLAGFAKVSGLASFSAQVGTLLPSSLSGASRFVSLVIPSLELAIGFQLLSGARPYSTALLSLILLGLLTSVTAGMFFRPDAATCGCFGPVLDASLSPTPGAALGRNVLLLTLNTAFFFLRPRS